MCEAISQAIKRVSQAMKRDEERRSLSPSVEVGSKLVLGGRAAGIRRGAGRKRSVASSL
jgi:hypothetical protein